MVLPQIECVYIQNLWKVLLLILFYYVKGTSSLDREIIVIEEEEYAFIKIPGNSSYIEYSVDVLDGPFIDIYFLTEENFHLFQTNSWTWKFIDAGSKQATKHANTMINIPQSSRTGNMDFYLVLDNSAIGQAAPPQWNSKEDPVTVQVSIRVPGSPVDHLQGIRTVPLARWTLLAFLAILPAWPLLRHYFAILQMNGVVKSFPMWHLGIPLLISAFMAIPLRPVEKGLHNALINVIDINEGFSSSLADAFLVAGLTEELTKWVIMIVSDDQSFYLGEQRGGNKRYHILRGLVISMGFAIGENICYGFHSEYSEHSGFSTLFIRALTAFPSHTVSGIVMGYHWAKGNLIYSLLLPLFAHGLYDFPILLTERGLFDRDILVILVLLLLYAEDAYALRIVLSAASKFKKE